ncbi:MAG: serine/threonine protein kinase [Planctomycetes bacterium]|nr:serine/threonine protein kinase [Planctomycetota bacterium]
MSEQRKDTSAKQDLSETSPMKPGDTVSVDQPAGGSRGVATVNPSSMSSVVGNISATEEVLQEIAKSGTNVDSLVGRLVVDNGLATQDEVKVALEMLKSAQNAPTTPEERNQRSLLQVLVDQEFVTKRQIARLRPIIEAEKSGQKIPGYKIIKKLGAGAMASVMLGRQLSLDRLVAIKLLPKKFTGNPQFIERFYAEGRAAAQLNHPNIVQAYDVGKAGDYHYFVMEYVEGRTAYDDIARLKRYTEKDAIEIILQISEALLHAHEKGLIHRDVKPKNIMITKEGVAKLADMGLARAISDKEAAEAEAGKAFGTPYYISPEQIRGEKNITPAADIYSLGATLYHMLTGQVPFEGKNPSEVMHKHLKAELPQPDHINAKLSAGISEIVEMMMAKDPGQRYRNCRDLIVDLKAVKMGQHPPLAHKDFRGADLASLANAEQSAVAVIPAAPEVEFGSPMVRPWLFWTLVAVLVVSVTFNIILLATRASGGS